MQPPRRRHRIVTPEESRLWREAMRDAEPLDRKEPASPTHPADQPAAPQPPPKNQPAGPTKTAMLTAKPPPTPHKHFTITQRPQSPEAQPERWPTGVDHRTDQRLRRGRMEIQGTIDLHGMNRATAHIALSGFLNRSAMEGKRCVLVITGKGGAEGTGVLRHAVPRWLAEPPLRSLIVAHHPAQPKHGGDGALYVLLKRLR